MNLDRGILSLMAIKDSTDLGVLCYVDLACYDRSWIAELRTHLSVWRALSGV